MRRAVLLASVLLAACSPAGEGPQNPRAKTGDRTAPAVWTAITSPEGAAMVYARPGAAPDLMLWRKAGADGVMMRAHVFIADPATVALSVETASGHFDARDPKLQAGLQGSGQVMIEGRLNDQAVEAMTAPEGFIVIWAAQTYRAAPLPGAAATTLIQPLPAPGTDASVAGRGPSQSAPAPGSAAPAR